MKKKVVYLLLAVAIIGLLSLKPLGIISRSESYFELKETMVVEKFEAADFYVELADGYRINVEFTGNDGKYTGTVYLPGNVDTSDCKLSWNSEEDTYISKRLKHYGSGEFPLAGDGYKAIFMLNCGDNKYDLMLKTAVCSANVEPLLISIDESMGTITDMNADWNHETSCYGELNFEDANYYMSIKGRGNATWHYCPKKPYNISFLKEAYENLRNRIGCVPEISDFKKYGSVEISKYFDKFGSYYAFLTKYYPDDCHVRLNEHEEIAVEYFSRKLTNTKRIHELNNLALVTPPFLQMETAVPV